MGRKAGRKARRALRKRMNPKQQPCCERMRGPIPEEFSQGVPKLPRGGDGLAIVSLRPSLAPHGTHAGVLSSTSEFKVSSPRRPHTASGQQRQAASVQRRGSTSGRRRSELSSTLPVMLSGTEAKPAGNSVGQADIEDSSDVPEVNRTTRECRDPIVQESVEHSHISPLRPLGGSRSARQYVDAGQRTFRNRETSAPSNEGTVQISRDGDHGAAPPKEPGLQDDTNGDPDAGDMSKHCFGQLLSTTGYSDGERDEDVWSQSADGDGRSATVVLSSTVLLSPRGRARTPTLVETDGSLLADSTAGWRAASQDSAEEWAQSLSPRPCTAPESCLGRGAWSDLPAAFNLSNDCYDERWIPPATDVRQHMVTQEHEARMERRIGQGHECLYGSRRPGTNGSRPASRGSPNDEFAGDREIAYFIASEAEAVEIPATISPAAADPTFSEGRAAPTTASPLSSWPATTLVAVPVHADDPSQRYDPYHLRIVSRELDGGERWACAMEGISDDRGKFCGKWGDVSSESPLLRETSAACPPQGDGGGREGDTRRQRAPGYEVDGDEVEQEERQGDGRDVERAYINVKGVTYINKYGETSFQPLDEWRQEKERLDAMRQMNFVRSYPVWKYFRAITTFVGTKRVDQLKGKIEKGLVTLDPVCRLGVEKVVVQLERIQSLQLVTAVKGSTASYGLNEFFDEQSRNVMECERELLDVYDRCGKILGRMAKEHLEAEGLLVMNRGWNQASAAVPAYIGSPTKDRLLTDTTDAGFALLEQSRSSTVMQAKPRETVEQAIDGEEYSADTPPTSWSFAARQRCECARIARVFRYARHRMRQELRGLALNHAELLLGAVTRMVAADGAAGECSPDGESPGGWRHQHESRQDNDGYKSPGGVGPRDQPMGRTRTHLRHEARPHDAWNRRWALAVDEENMGELSTLGLEGATPEIGIGDRSEGGAGAIAGARADLLVEWRKAFRRTVALTAGICHPARLCASQRTRFSSRISLPDSCLSVPRAIQLACELVPHAVETLAIKNPLGAKPVLTEMFEAEITPNLCGEEFFPMTHRFYGEKKGLTEDAFLSATMKLSAECLGGIDAQLSELSRWERAATRGCRVSGIRHKIITREKAKWGYRIVTGRRTYEPPLILDASAWGSNKKGGSLLGIDTAAQPSREEAGLQEKPAKTSTQKERPSEVCGISTGPCGGINLKVDIRGNFDEWDLRVHPPLGDFVSRTRCAQLEVLAVLARVPCLLEHPEVKPYQTMVEGYGLGFDLPQGGIDEDGENSSGANSTTWECMRADATASDEIVQETVQAIEGSLHECDWLENLSRDPYYRGLQDKVLLSLACSHNAIYRMVNGFRPLLEEFQALGAFDAERDERTYELQHLSEPDVIAEQLITSVKQKESGANSLDLSSVLLATSTIDWLNGWYSRFERFRHTVRSRKIDSPQALLSVNATKFIAYLAALPENSLQDIRIMGPRLMLQHTATLGAVFRRCNAVLSGGLVGVDAMGEKASSRAGFLGQIEMWLGQLRHEVKKLQELGLLLKNIGCFDPSLAVPSTVETRRVNFAASTGGLPAQGIAPAEAASGCKPSPTLSPSETPAKSREEDDALAVGDIAGAQDQPLVSAGGQNVGSRPSLGNGRGVSEKGGMYDFRAVENQTQEAVESLEFHLTVLQRSVDQAHINMRIASQEFSSLLHKALESLARDIERFEADILDPALSSAATDPAKACSRLEGYRHRLADLQEEESRYRYYNQLLDNELVKRVAKAGAKHQFDEESMRLDLERVGVKRRQQLVLKWEAHRTVCNIRKEWEESTLISRDAGDMARQLARAARAHAFAEKSAGGPDEVSASCEETLAHLGRMVEAVGFLSNRNLTAAYWERVEQAMPLAEDLKAAARNESMAKLRFATGLDAPPATTKSTADSGKNVHHSEESPPVEGNGDLKTGSSTGRGAPTMATEAGDESASSGAINAFSSLAARVLAPRANGSSKPRVGKAAMALSSAAGRGRREEARRRAELYEVFPMAAEWGGVLLATLLSHGLLDKTKTIGSISAEATASAVLQKTLDELEGVWESAPMVFTWHFNEGPPTPGNTRQPPLVNADSIIRRKLFSRVLAEPAFVSRGYSTGAVGGGLSGGGGVAGGEADGQPASEGFTPLLSNGDELLRLAEHCRVVVDSVVDAPPALLAVGDIGKAALKWQKRIHWFQELVTLWMAVQEQWVRLAPAFVPGDLDDGVPAHERVRFTDMSGLFQNILGTLRADKILSVLAQNQQGTEKAGRSLLARVRKLQEDLEGVSIAMDRRVVPENTR
ncbi:unnamed protein product [Scytosiphon promiscuus]